MGKRLSGLSVLLSLFMAGSLFAAEDPKQMFAEANALYEERMYDSAVTLYQSLVDQGTTSAPIYFNLGNAYFKEGDLGHAMLYYLRAKRLDPSDADISQNLQFAKQFSRVQMEGVELNPINSLLVSITDSFRLNTLAWMSSLFFIFLFCLLIVRYGLGMFVSWAKVGVVLLTLLLLICSGLTTFKYKHDYLTRRAVVIADEGPVYTGPSEQSDIELQGSPGLVVEIISESGSFYDVLFENKRRGWILKDLVAEI